MEKHELKFASGIKKIRSVNLDLGVVKKTKKMYNGNLSHHIEVLLDQWCQEKDEGDRVHQIVQKTIKDLKKAGSTMPEKEAIKMLMEISEDERKALLETPSSIRLKQELEADIPIPTKDQREHAKKVLTEMRKKINEKAKDGGKS